MLLFLIPKVNNVIMADETDRPAPISTDMLNGRLSEIGSAHAPFLYFEDASAFGFLNGVVRITLEAVRTVPSGQGNGVISDRVITAHLRMNIPAALSLKAAIEGALLIARPAESETKN